MGIVFVILSLLFCGKLAWNISVPMWLRPGAGVSMHTHVEIGLLVGMMLVATRPTLVAVVGVTAIAASWGGAFAFGYLLGWRYHSRR